MRFPRWLGLVAIAFGLLVAGVVFWGRSQPRVVSEAEMQRRTQPSEALTELPTELPAELPLVAPAKMMAPLHLAAPAKIEKHTPPPTRTSRR